MPIHTRELRVDSMNDATSPGADPPFGSGVDSQSAPPHNQWMAPQGYAAAAESAPQLPAGTEERVSGYGVMGVPFASGDVLGLRRWTASSVGDPFTSIWHRAPDGRWRFLESMVSEASCTVACSRWFGRGATESVPAEIDLTWTSPSALHVGTADGQIDWHLRLASSPVTRLMNAMSAAVPAPAWKSRSVLRAMGSMATLMLGVGRVGLTGRTANDQDFLANPWRIWRVVESSATIAGADAGPPAPLPEQARLGDFWIPQSGIFAMGRVYVHP